MDSDIQMERIMTDADGWTHLHCAAKLGFSDTIRNLLEKTSDASAFKIIDHKKRNLLHVAIQYKRIDVVNLIFQNESLITHLINQKDCNGNTPLGLLMGSMIEMEGIMHGCKPLHWAAMLGYSDEIRNLLNKRTNYIGRQIADKITSAFEIIDHKERNMLHVAIEHKQIDVVKLIFDDESSTSIINQKDGNGDTPLHLLMASDLDMKGIVIDDEFSIHVMNNNHYTPLDRASPQEKGEILKEAMTMLGGEHGQPRRRLWEDLVKKIKQKRKKQVFTKIGDNVVIVVSLIATATFAAAFAIPGGFDGNDGPNQGMPILLKKAVYKVFVVANALAFSCSCTVLFVYIRLQLVIAGQEEKDGSINMISLQYLLTGIAMVAMAVAFVAGSYVILTPSLGFAIPVCAMCLCIMVPLSIFPAKRLGFVTAMLSKLVVT